MIIAFIQSDGRLHRIDESDHDALAKAVWIDLTSPTEEEARAVEHATGLYVSSQTELQEIESSSRLSEEEGVLYLSTPTVIGFDRRQVRTLPLGVALSKDRLLTIRFARSRSFDQVIERAPRLESAHQSGVHVLVTLFETMVDALADEMEHMRDELDAISARVFQGDLGTGRAPRHEDAALRDILRTIGNFGDAISRIRESLLGVGRIVPYIVQTAEWCPVDLRPRMKAVRQDIQSLSDYDTHLTEKIQFLLDATLGFINIAQNNIMKVFTILSVIGIPPVLVAGIYGMNFKNMPELDWAWGYPYALVLTVVSILVPLAIFRARGWL